MRLQSKIMAVVIPFLLIPVIFMTAVFNYYAQDAIANLAESMLVRELDLVAGRLEEIAGPTGEPPSEEATQQAQAAAIAMLNQFVAGGKMKVFVVREDGQVIFHENPSFIGQNVKEKPWFSLLQGSEAGVSRYTGLADQPELLVHRLFSPWNWYICASGPVDFFMTDIYRAINSALILMVMSMGLVVGGLYLFLREVLRPVQALIEETGHYEGKTIQFTLEATSEDEIGELTDQLAAIGADVQRKLDDLEQRVIERTNDLHARSALLEKIAEVAREVSGIHDTHQLLSRTVQLISEKFDYYHVGIFLVDPLGEAAVMQAASSSGGQRMVARGHRRKLGEGIVGYVAQTGEPRIALDVEGDAVFRASPDLPLTRSEMALPLRGLGRVLGVLDVQSVEGGAFTSEDIAILQTLAEQVALAIENARLLEASRQALADLEELYGQRIREAWQARLSNRASAYVYRGLGMEPIPEDETSGELQAPTEPGRRLSSTIRLREQPIGSIVLWQDPERPSWSEEERGLLETVSSQIGLALENARLIEETRTTAARERLMGEISAQLRTSTDINTILQTTVMELGDLLGASGLIRLESEGELQTGDEPHYPEI